MLRRGCTLSWRYTESNPPYSTSYEALGSESSSVSRLTLFKFAPPASLHYGGVREYSLLLELVNAKDEPGALPVLPKDANGVPCSRPHPR